MFPRRRRITKNKEFENIFKNGRGAYADCLGFKFVKNGLGYTRVAVLVGKKVSKRANKRNRLKRQIREIIRLRYDNFGAVDLVVTALPAALGKNFQELQTAINYCLHKSRLE